MISEARALQEGTFVPENTDGEPHGNRHRRDARNHAHGNADLFECVHVPPVISAQGAQWLARIPRAEACRCAAAQASR